MADKGYDTQKNENDYAFFSKGPKGTIPMIIRFTLLEQRVYNVALASYNKKLNSYDDNNLTGNGDGMKIFQTVANCIVDFLKRNPHASVHAEGNWIKKTKAYCRLIQRNYVVISNDYMLSALNSENESWEDFKGECEKYLAFRAKRKAY